MLAYPGAMSVLSADDITIEMLSSAGHLHVSSIFLQPGLRKGIVSLNEKAKYLGLTTSLDPQWEPAEKWELPAARQPSGICSIYGRLPLIVLIRRFKLMKLQDKLYALNLNRKAILAVNLYNFETLSGILYAVSRSRTSITA